MPEDQNKLYAELLERELARRSLSDFCRRIYKDYISGKHIDVLVDRLQQVERYVATMGEEGIGRLMVMMPPRHSKSLHVSQLFPAWFLGRNPDKRIINASHGAELAERFSKEVRDIVRGDNYKILFGGKSAVVPVELDPLSRSKQEWDIKGHRGGYYAVGVGGSTTGRGGDLIIIDDPVKDAKDADSEASKRDLWNWWTSVARTRLQPGGAIIIMMTRWRHDDLIGRILDEKGEKWEVLKFPAIAEEEDVLGRIKGDPLWPEYWPLDSLMEVRDDIGERDWQALYQQSPTAEEGALFKKNWFVYQQLPQKDDITRGIQVWDTAFTQRKENDPSACVTAYQTRDGIFIADIWTDRVEFPELKLKMMGLYSQWSDFFRISKVYVENKGSGISVIQALKRDSNLPIIGFEPDSEMGKDKVSRATVASGYMESGRIAFREKRPWQGEMERELLEFPHGKHDDIVDAISYAVIHLKGGGRPKKRLSDAVMKYRNRGDRHEQIMGAWL